MNVADGVLDAPPLEVALYVTSTPWGVPETWTLKLEVPVVLEAVALKRYDVPFVSPVIVQLVAGTTTVQVFAGERATSELV